MEQEELLFPSWHSRNDVAVLQCNTSAYITLLFNCKPTKVVPLKVYLK